MMGNVRRFGIEGLVLVLPRIFADERGRFMETWSERAFRDEIGEQRFVQENESTSRKGVLRGLHLQLPPHAQGKLVRVVHGAVLDVCVDARRESPTYGGHERVMLNSADGAALWIPAGFAHGFVALQDDTILQYKCTAPYEPSAERTIRWDDPDLDIDWGIADPIISAKDRIGIPFNGSWMDSR